MFGRCRPRFGVSAVLPELLSKGSAIVSFMCTHGTSALCDAKLLRHAGGYLTDICLPRTAVCTTAARRCLPAPKINLMAGTTRVQKLLLPCGCIDDPTSHRRYIFRTTVSLPTVHTCREWEVKIPCKIRISNYPVVSICICRRRWPCIDLGHGCFFGRPYFYLAGRWQSRNVSWGGLV